MGQLSALRKIFGLVLIVALLTARIGSLSHETFVEPIQSYISQAAFFSSDDAKPAPILCKPNRPSEAVVWGEEAALPAYFPLIQNLSSYQPFQAMPEVFLDIFIPPDPLLLSA